MRLIMSVHKPIKEIKVKTKIKKVKSSKDFSERLAGVGTWRITGPSKSTGKRVNIEFVGTREQAEKVVLE